MRYGDQKWPTLNLCVKTSQSCLHLPDTFFGCFITTFFGYEDMLLATRHQLFQKGTMEVRVLPLQISFPVTISHHNQIKNTSHSTHGFHSAFKWQVLVYLLYHCFLSAYSGSQPIKNHITISLYYLCMIGKICHWQYKYNKNEKVYLVEL